MKGLLLLAFGGPRSLEEVDFFMTRLFHGRRPSAEQIEEVKERYRLIGGCSPLPQITQEQARRLEERLRAKGYPFKSFVGMRYGHPLIEETLKEMIEEGFQEIVSLPMTPFQSQATTGAYMEEVNRVKRELGKEISLSFVVGWHLHPLYLEAVREKIKEKLEEFHPEERKRIHLLFTAHSLPKSIIEKDPYAQEIEATIKGVLEGMGPLPWHMAYQSKGRGSEEWVGPSVESVLENLLKEKIREVLIIPIGFVSDHIEILYDIGILCRRKAESLGMVMKWTSSLNFSDRFVEALAAIVEDHLKG